MEDAHNHPLTYVALINKDKNDINNDKKENLKTNLKIEILTL